MSGALPSSGSVRHLSGRRSQKSCARAGVCVCVVVVVVVVVCVCV